MSGEQTVFGGYCSLWTCFTCNYIGNSEESDSGEAYCPNCGTIVGDGFGMAENDPRFYADPQHPPAARGE